MARLAALFLLACCAALAIAQDNSQPVPPAEGIVKPQRIRVAEGVMDKMIVNKVQPAYPPLARQARIQGVVLLQVLIGKTGDIENIQLISGHPMLAPAAIDAVKQWKYRPFLLNGEAVNVETKLMVNFVLETNPPADAASSGDSTGSEGSVVSGVVCCAGSGGKDNPDSGTSKMAVPQRVRISSGVASGLLIRKVQPGYPKKARQQHIQGLVVLKAHIDKEGSVDNLEPISGPDILIPPSIEAVRQWKYKPYLLNGTAVEVETQIQVSYTLQN